MKIKVLKIISYILCAAGIMAAGASSVGCMFIILDEPKMPNSML